MTEPAAGRRRGGGFVAPALLAAVLAVLSGCTSSTPSSAQRPAPSPTSAGNPDYAVTCLAVGAAVGKSDPVPQFRQAETRLGDLTIRRSFDTSLPRSFQRSAAASDPAAGLHSFVSWKPPHGDHAGAAAGKYDRQIAAWARSVPRTGEFATAWHEPENDMTAPEFVAMERHVYTVVKKANPTIRFGPVYMAYRWDPTDPAHYVGDPTAWWPGSAYADFAGFDWYGRNPVPMTTSSSFTNWYTTMARTGVPLVIAEYGQYFQPAGKPVDPQKNQARAAAIRQDASWIFAHSQIKAWLYWQSGGETGSWRIDDPASQAAWQSVAARGCRS